MVDWFLLTLFMATPPPSAAGKTPVPAGWEVHKKGEELSPDERRCANRSASLWCVFEEDGAVSIAQVEPDHCVREVPIPPHEWMARLKPRAFSETSGGEWLVAVDRGEFEGGGLWRFSDAGTSLGRLIQSNVAHLQRGADGSLLAFAGMAHLTVNRGRVYRVSDNGGHPSVVLLGALDGKARAVGATAQGVLAVTDHGIWSVRPRERPSKLVNVSLERLAPRSIVRDSGGAICVGLRAFVLRLLPAESGFAVEWLIPQGCGSLALRGEHCE